MYSKYLEDEEMAGVCSEARFVSRLIRVESALAAAQAKVGLIPPEAARALEDELAQVRVDPAELADGTLRHGVPTIPLLARLRSDLSAAEYLHFGVTSQDVMDTARALGIRDGISVLRRRLVSLLEAFLALIEAHRSTPCMAHTRGQQAMPIPFGLRVAGWALPFVRSFDRLGEMMPRLLVVQLGGPTGSLAAFGDKGLEVMRALAYDLELRPSMPWHAQRDIVAEFASWLALLSGSAGKMAQDVLSMSRTEVGEIREPSGGASSSMPHKSNPVLSEAVVALALENAHAVGLQQESLLHDGERDGRAWILEWRNLERMMIRTSAALAHAATVARGMEVDEEAMLHNIGKTNGRVFAGRAITLLSETLPSSEARRVVQDACSETRDSRNLALVLSERLPEIDWTEELRPEACVGASRAMIDEAVTRIEGIIAAS